MQRMIPNLVSASRLVLSVPLAAMMWAGRHSDSWRWAAVGLFAWVACSDWLDGLLARLLDARTELGRLLDPAADKVVALVCFLTLAWAGMCGYYYHLPGWLVAVVIGKDLWLTVGYLVARMMGIQLPVRPSRWGKASTALQLTLVGSILVRPELGRAGLGWLAAMLIWPAAATTVVVGASYTWTAVRRLATVRLAG